MSNSPHLLDVMLNPTLPPQAQRIMEEEIKLGPIVGTGGFSDVHLGHWTDPGRTEQLAVKCFRCVHNNNDLEISRTMERRLRREEETWRRAQPHPNILPFLGVFHRNPPHFPALVSPFRPDGNIGEYLHKYDADRRQLCIGIVNGLVHLHHHNIIHGDLKPSNILIHRDSEGNVVPQISDFGRAKVSDIKGYTGSLRATHRYAAPEVLFGSLPSPENSAVGIPLENGNRVLTKCSDIYSLGMVLLHTVSGVKPYPDMNVSQMVLALHNHQEPQPDVYECDRPVRWIWPLLQLCWGFGGPPTERCTAQACLKQLKMLPNPKEASDPQLLESEDCVLAQN